MTVPQSEMRELAAAAAHELKNPVALALAHVGLIRLTDESRAMSTHCDRIEQALSDITALAALFIQLANGDIAGDTSVELAAILDSLIQEYRAAWPAVVFTCETPSSPLCYNGSAARIRMIFTNLLKNAIEAAGPRGYVAVTAETADEAIKITVTDSGPGLDDYTLQKLSAGGYTAKPGGSGMGVMICRAFAARMGGSFELTNNTGGGGKAVLTLPLPQ